MGLAEEWCLLWYPLLEILLLSCWREDYKNKNCQSRKMLNSLLKFRCPIYSSCFDNVYKINNFDTKKLKLMFDSALQRSSLMGIIKIIEITVLHQ